MISPKSAVNVNVPDDSAISTPAPPVNVIVPPNAVAVELEPSVTVMVLLVSFELLIEPASIASVIPNAFTCNVSVSISIELSSTFTDKVGD